HRGRRPRHPRPRHRRVGAPGRPAPGVHRRGVAAGTTGRRAMSPDDDPGARYRPRESWVDRQIREATERGEFDDLPGAGKPIPDIRAPRDENAWVKSFLERENVSMPLPESLQLRKDVAELQATLADVRREVHAREI